MKEIIYFTDNRLDNRDFEKKVSELVRESIKNSGLPIVSCSLKPMDFGKNIVLNLEPSVLTMFKQILAALEACKGKYIFFCEHDVLYHSSHFSFTPPNDDTFYYNTNVWRCQIKRNLCTSYDKLRSVSGLCVNRDLAIEHYRKRLKYIYKRGFDKIPVTRNPAWARKMGYEPGKSPRIGGFSKDKIDDWKSKYPNIDIRHRLTTTAAKMSLSEFRHLPIGWQEKQLEEIPGWDLKNLFKI